MIFNTTHLALKTQGIGWFMGVSASIDAKKPVLKSEREINSFLMGVEKGKIGV